MEKAEAPREFTQEQLAAIRGAIKAGRAAMRKRPPPSPLVFVRDFLAADGMQVPGREIRPEHLKVLGGIVTSSLVGGGVDWPMFRNWRWIDDDMQDAVIREVNRAFMESNMETSRQSSNAYAFRLRWSDSVNNPVAAKRIAESDCCGLGAGLFPLNDVMILPVALDRAWFEVIFRDEAPADVAPAVVQAIVEPMGVPKALGGADQEKTNAVKVGLLLGRLFRRMLG